MKLVPILLFAFILSTQLASAFTYINIYIDENGEAIFLGETDETPALPEGVRIDNGEILGRTQTLTDKQDETWTFSYILPNSELNIILPERAKIQSISNPEAEISIDGKRISVFAKSAVTINYTVDPAPNSFVANLPILVILLAVLIIAIVYLMNYSKREKRDKKNKQTGKKSRKQDKIEIIKQVLNDREKAILDKLKETGKIKSSHLRKLLDIPKASFSRHLQELDKKSLVKRTGEGKNKFVELSK